MPSAVIKSFAKKSGKSEAEVEKLWKETKQEVKDKFKYKTPAFWAYVNDTIQKKLGIKESKDSKLSFKDFCLFEEDKNWIEAGDQVQLVKALGKGIDAKVGETFSVIDVDDDCNLRISHAFGAEYQDTYFKKSHFKKI